MGGFGSWTKAAAAVGGTVYGGCSVVVVVFLPACCEQPLRALAWHGSCFGARTMWKMGEAPQGKIPETCKGGSSTSFRLCCCYKLVA